MSNEAPISVVNRPAAFDELIRYTRDKLTTKGGQFLSEAGCHSTVMT